MDEAEVKQAKLEERVELAVLQVCRLKSYYVLIAEIVEAASMYWRGLDPYDFCVQNSSPQLASIVFGSTNRLIWSPFTGFYADRSYCSARFLEQYDRLGPIPGKEGR